MRRRNVKARMRQLLDEIDYDFSHFTLEEFARWLEDRRGRRIVFVPWTMPPALSGAWAAECGGSDYIFYEEHTHPLHQAHIKLHELAHMLCGHSTVEVGSGRVQAFLDQTTAAPAAAQHVLLRSVKVTGTYATIDAIFA